MKNPPLRDAENQCLIWDDDDDGNGRALRYRRKPARRYVPRRKTNRIVKGKSWR